MSDPYPMHPDQVEAHDLFHSNGCDCNKPTSASGQDDDNFENKDVYVPGDDIVQNKLFTDNVMENEQFVVQNVPFDSNYAVNRTEESNLLWPVLPFQSGEGLPYAPIDWPYPGDIWTWRVGRRFSSSGYFQDRFLYLPKRLGKQMFASKNAIVYYFNSNFPGADVDAFFASFAWKIPVKMQSLTKVERATLLLPAPPQEEIVASQEEVNAENGHSSPRKRRRTIVASYAPQEETEDDEEQLSSTPKRKRPGRPRLSSSPKSKRGRPRLSSPPKPKQIKRSGGKFSSASKKAKQIEAALTSSPKPKTRQTPRRYSKYVPNNEGDVEPVVEPIPEDFDNFLISLEDILNQPLDVSEVTSSTTTVSAAGPIEMAEARSKLSSLLVMDFPSLISPNIITELATLASKLREDPTMNAEQLVKLKLIEEIPSFSEVFLESRELIAQVDEFCSALKTKKSKAASLKNEYGVLREKAEQLHSHVIANSLAVDEIERQIALLRSRRAELTNAIETSKAAKAEVTYVQKVVASTIQKVVHEIQLANSKMPDLNLRKTNALKHEAEIRAKFAPLQGFSL